VKVVHIAEDRRDHFESMKDVYEMFRVIIAERKRREVDPTLRLLTECLENETNDEDSLYATERIGELHEFFQLTADFYEKADRIPTKAAVKAIRASDRLLKALKLG
jgi:DNA-binding transcriptional regulator GbsR (MarR family)